MLNKTIALLAFVFVVNIVHAQNILCGSYLDDPACAATSAFSVDNVHRILSFAAQEAPIFRLLEASWHETELIFVTLGDVPEGTELWRAASENPMLKYLDLHSLEYIRFGAFSLVKRLAVNESLSQLAVTSDLIIVGTNTGSLLFWDLRQEWIPFVHPTPTGGIFEQARRYDERKELPSEELPVSKGEISEILIHPAGEWLLAVVDYSRVFRVDLESKSVAEIEFQAGEDQMLEVLAFSDNGLLLAAVGNGSIRIWDTNSWEAWEPAALSAESIEKLLFTASDSQLIVLADASVSRWSLRDKSLNFVGELASYPGKRPCLIRDGDISLDGSLLMTTDDCDQYRAWDLTVDKEMFIPQLDFSSDWSGAFMQFSPDGFYLLGGYSNAPFFSITFVNIYHESMYELWSS